MFRIVWQFDCERVRLEDLSRRRRSVLEGLGLARNIRPCPVFQDAQAEVEDGTYESFRDPDDDLARYYQVIVESEEEARLVLASLREARNRGSVRWFDIQADIGPQRPAPEEPENNAIPCEFDSGPEGPSRVLDRCQLYLGPAGSELGGAIHFGIDARFGWGIRGGRGEGVRLVDIERGWNLQHEDLIGQGVSRFGDSPPDPHGTAVLGILCAAPLNSRRRRQGVIGIAHRATVGVAPFLGTPNQELNPEGVVRHVLNWLSPGDVLLFEVQAIRPGISPAAADMDPFLPLEAWRHGRAAIRQAHAKGVYVVEAAGNGGLALNERDHDVPRTGSALMVGAGHFQTGDRLFFSNHGPRIDLQGWGHNVVTTGAAADDYNDLQLRDDTNRCYTASFNGTSSAAAIVAGCVAAISGVVKAHGFDPLSPEEMKDLLQRTGSFRDRSANGNIGPLPNLRAALEDLEIRYQNEHPGFMGFERIQGGAVPQRLGSNGNGKVRRSFLSLSSLSTNQNDRRNTMSKKQSVSGDQIEQAYRKALEAYGGRENVTGVDVGYKYEGKKVTDQTAVRIHVRQKVNPFALESDEAFPEEIDGVPVDVIEAVYTPQAGNPGNAARRKRRDPIQPGVSVAHRNVTAGTLGAMVFDRITGKPAILSNWHVLAGSSTAKAGDPILQPGPMDGGQNPQNVVATLTRSVLNANGDAALALLNGSRGFIGEQFGSGVQLQGTRMVRRNDVVEKSGRSTGVTRGRVDGVGRYFIDYSVGRVGVDGFKIVTVRKGNPGNEEISSGGDSGAVWYSPDSREALGLHFAGETDPRPEEEHALACHMPRVLTALNASLLAPEIAPRDESRPSNQISTEPAMSQLSDVADWLISNREPLQALLKALEGMNVASGNTPTWHPNGNDSSDDSQRIAAY